MFYQWQINQKRNCNPCFIWFSKFQQSIIGSVCQPKISQGNPHKCFLCPRILTNLSLCEAFWKSFRIFDVAWTKSNIPILYLNIRSGSIEFESSRSNLKFNLHTEKYFLNLINPKPNFDYNYTFPIDLASDGIPVSGKSIGKV